MFSQAEFHHRNADGTGTRWKDIWSDGVDRSCTTGMGTKPLIIRLNLVKRAKFQKCFFGVFSLEITFLG